MYIATLGLPAGKNLKNAIDAKADSALISMKNVDFAPLWECVAGHVLWLKEHGISYEDVFIMKEVTNQARAAQARKVRQALAIRQGINRDPQARVIRQKLLR